MVVGGFQKTTLSDFPGVLSCIVFTRGCNFRCPYCHNPELVDPARFPPAISWNEITRFLRSREGRIEGVVVTGGEPTLHEDLPDRLQELKGMDLKVKLDTNGSNPGAIRRVLADRAADFISMDLKAPLDLYGRVAGASVDTEAIRESLELLRTAGLPCEIRITYVPSLLALDDLLRAAQLASAFDHRVMQAFRSGKTLDPALGRDSEPTAAQLSEAASRLAAAGARVRVR